MAQGEIDFSDDELRELGIELLESDEARRKRKKSMLRVPLDEVPRAPPPPLPAETLTGPAAPPSFGGGPPPVPEDAASRDLDQVVSSSPAPDRSGPRVAVTDEVSGRVAGNRASVRVTEPGEELDGEDI